MNPKTQRAKLLHDNELNLEAHHEADCNHHERAIPKEQEMMVALAFVLPMELRQFSLFPYVIFIDATEDSNKEGQPLIMICGKDSNGKMFTVLRCLLPSQKSWAYCWFFHTAIPALIPKATLDHMRLAFTDGDSQEIGQLEDAMVRYYPNVRRNWCSWHVVDRG